MTTNETASICSSVKPLRRSVRRSSDVSRLILWAGCGWSGLIGREALIVETLGIQACPQLVYESARL